MKKLIIIMLLFISCGYENNTSKSTPEIKTVAFNKGVLCVELELTNGGWLHVECYAWQYTGYKIYKTQLIKYVSLSPCVSFHLPFYDYDLLFEIEAEDRNGNISRTYTYFTNKKHETERYKKWEIIQ